MRSILCIAAVTLAALVPQNVKACDDVAAGFALYQNNGCGVVPEANFGFANSYAVPQMQLVGGSGGFVQRGFVQRGFVQRGFVQPGFSQPVFAPDPFLAPQTVIIQERPLGLLDIAAPFIFDRGFRGRSFGRGFDRGFGRGFGPRRGFDRGFGRGFGRGRRF